MASDQTISKKSLWAGRIVSGFAVLFFVMDGVMKLFKPAFVVEATVHLGYPESDIVGIGVLLLASTTLYLVPRTSILGAILLTGYLGGAAATQVRAEAGWFNVCRNVWGPGLGRSMASGRPRADLGAVIPAGARNILL